MGGMPWTSRGCKECKRRKVKCDERFPECMRCVNRGFKCPGPRKKNEVIYVSHGDETNEKFQPHPLAKPWKYLGFEKQDEKTASQDLIPVAPPVQTVHMGPMINVQLFSTYFGTYFPDPEPTSSTHMWPSIISRIMSQPQKSAMLQHTCASLSRVYLGKVKQDKALFYDGLRLFNHAIRLFSKHLNQNSHAEEFVHAAVIFQEIQTYFCPESIIELFAHIEGLNAILKHQAPKAFNNGAITSTYLHHAKQRTTWLSIFQLFWLFQQLTEDEIKFIQEPYDGTPVSGVLWGFSETARLVHVLDKIDKSNRETCQSLFNDCQALQEFFAQLYPKIETTNGNIPKYAPGELKSELPPTDDIFGPPYRFCSLDEARLHTWLWGSMSLLYPIYSRCIQILKSYHPGVLPASINPAEWTIYGHQMTEFYAYESARAMPYCARQGMGTEGLYYAPHGLFIISRLCSDARNREGFVWCDESLRVIDRSGNDAAGRLREYLWNYWSEADKQVPSDTSGIHRGHKVDKVDVVEHMVS
ncbi:hypothetical protein N7456_012279 [Penicillium angulare]|uniref:Zn(2)-C6 fungal-type domain-containing protein n=1 Tax=Penicillium angulare TaxID=116970 RepID=A0A9W9K0K8_9EURO|nr:hypothetical protein N7456_012279 [Penicillium angulare]